MENEKQEQEREQEGKKKAKRDRGQGCLYKRGNTWWMKYYVNGKPERESCETQTKSIAEARLNKRLREIEGGKWSSAARKVKMEELAQDYIREYKLNKRKSLKDAIRKWTKWLKPFFGHLFAASVTSDHIEQYQIKRQKDGATNATINRETSSIGRMFTLAVEATPPKVLRAPKIKKLPEDNVRTGFLTDDRYQKLADACSRWGLWLRTMFEVGYTFGWRSSEVKKLRVRQVELAECRIILEVGTTKNKKGRTVKFQQGSVLAELLEKCIAGKGPDDYVFTRPNGKPVKEFKRAWRIVCCEAGEAHYECRKCGTVLDASRFCTTCKVKRTKDAYRTVGLLFHDLRRSAARNARASGVSEGVIMKMAGWKTRSVFDRYAIVDEEDMNDAIDRIQKRRAQYGHNPPKDEDADDGEDGTLVPSS